MDPSFLGDDPGVGELAVELLVEFDPVGDHDECPRAGKSAQHLLGEPQHGQALAGSLGVPEHPEALVACGSDPDQVLDRGVDAEHLVVAGEALHQPTGSLHVGHEVLDQVEEPIVGAGPPDGCLKGDHAPSAVGVDDLPVPEEAPGGVGGPDLGLRAVGEDHEPVGPEELRDGVVVVAQVLVVGRLDRTVRFLELRQDQRDAIDEQDRVGPTAMEIPGDPHLRCGQASRCSQGSLKSM